MEKQPVVENSAEKQPEFRVLEVGPKGFGIGEGEPLVNTPNFVNREVPQGSQLVYDAIDIEPILTRMAKQSVGEKGHVTRADVVQLPYKDQSFDLVFMRNVLGDPGRSNNLKFENLLVSAFLGGRDKVEPRLPDINRVLKPGGRVVVVEEISPPDIEVVKTLLEGRGFEVELYPGGSIKGSRARDYLSDNDALNLMNNSHNYLVIAKKSN